MTKIYDYIQSPFGDLLAIGYIHQNNQLVLSGLIFPLQSSLYHKPVGAYHKPDLFMILKSELSDYFKGKQPYFKTLLDPAGTDFQKKVWHSLRQIQYGTTASYKEIAVSIHSPKASQAIGQANKKNPIPILIPCHRIINHSQKIGGYMGINNPASNEINIKEYLLNLEKVRSYP